MISKWNIWFKQYLHTIGGKWIQGDQFETHFNKLDLHIFHIIHEIIISSILYYMCSILSTLISCTSYMVFIRDTPRKKRNFIKWITTITIDRDIYYSHRYSIIYCRCTHVFYKYPKFCDIHLYIVSYWNPLPRIMMKNQHSTW